MIPIEIDDMNKKFRDLHFDKIKSEVKALVISKRNFFTTNNFEYQVLDWIDWHLNLILKSEMSMLREIINAFNSFIETFISTVTLIIIKDNNITIEQLKKICSENSITNFSNKNKDELVELVNNNVPLAGDTIKNLKFINLLERINSHLKDIFIDFYETKWDKIEDYDRYVFVATHNLKTCPYCNMGYILVSERNEKKENGLRPEIDHFFPKATYPYLAMSFYNLIPSCKVCNHTKSSKDTYKDGLLSPYEISDNTFKLTYIPKNMNFLKVKKRRFNSSNLDIKFKKMDEHSNSYFKLEKLYEQHSDVVLELLIKRTVYSKSYIKELKKNFKFTDDEIYRFLFCNYKEAKDLHKRPLSKLIKDISQELGLL